MEYLPLFHSLRDAPVLLVGGGRVALRKARLLTAAGARVTAVSPDIDPELEKMLEEHGGEWRRDVYRADCLRGMRLAVAATPDRAVNAAVAADANERCLPINVVDDPALCSVVFPAIVDRSPLVIAIASGARGPVLARLVRGRIEALIPAAYGRLAAFAGRFRKAVKAAVPGGGERRRFWERLVDGPIGEMVLAGREEDAARLVEEYIENPRRPRPRGEVCLIGAGPGDPDLLTFKAARLLQRADAVLYDRLVTGEVLDMARRDAERIYVGKHRAEHSVSQRGINRLLLDLARQGKCVVRLKGGDPFIFGRGGEEIELLAAEGIPFQVVPGITAASGCACYAGIPLTHRDYAHSVRFVAGQLRDGRVDLPWDELVGPKQTLVFYMGLQGLPTICRELQAHGLAPDMPVALIEQGTTPNQRTLVGTLATMEETVQRRQVHAPTLTIVGEVVSLRRNLAWYGEAEHPGKW